MIDQIAASLHTVLPAGSVPSVPGSLTVAALDVERFRASFVSPQVPVASPQLEPRVAGASAASGAGVSAAAGSGSSAVAAALPSSYRAAPEAPSIGESILSGLKNVSADTQERYKQITNVLTNPSPTVSELISLQFTLLQNSLQFELTSKLISKAPQTIDAIVKTQ